MVVFDVFLVLVRTPINPIIPLSESAVKGCLATHVESGYDKSKEKERKHKKRDQDRHRVDSPPKGFLSPRAAARGKPISPSLEEPLRRRKRIT